MNFAGKLLSTLKSAVDQSARGRSRSHVANRLRGARRMQMEPLERRELLSVDGFVGTIYSPNPTADEYFGTYVESLGDDFVVSSRESTNPAAYRIDPASGDVVQTYTPPSGTGRAFAISVTGEHVLMRGSTVVNQDGVTDEHIHLFDGDTGDILQTFVLPNQYNSFNSTLLPMVEYQVGNRNLILVSDRDYGEGIVHVFDTVDGDGDGYGDFIGNINNPEPDGSELFGAGISIQGNLIYITCCGSETYTDTNGNPYTEAMYAFDASSESLNDWTIEHTFYVPHAGGAGSWGNSLVLHGSRLYVGELGNDSVNLNAGAVHVFEAWAADDMDDLDGEYLQTWENPTPEESDYFGCSVAVVNNNILVGALGDRAGVVKTGSAYLYTPDGQLLQEYADPTPGVNDYFGVDIAVAGGFIAIGNSRDDVAGDERGAVQVFSADPMAIYISGGDGLLVSEDGVQASQTDTFDVVLGAAPATSVTLTLSVSDPTEAVLSDTTLTFDSTNWDTPKTVTITGVDDGLADNDQTFTVDVVADGFLPGSASVTCLDAMTRNQTFSTGAIDLSIPDPQGRTAGHLVSELEVSEAGTVRDLNLQLFITHPTLNGIHVWLESPNNTIAQVINGDLYAVGGGNSDIPGTILDDEAYNVIDRYDYPFDGTYAPQEPLSIFNGEEIQGTWTLHVWDAGKDKITGTLNEWSLFDTRYTMAQPPVPNDAPVASDDAYSVDEDSVLTVAAPGVLANDTDTDGPDALTAHLASGPAHGSLTLNAGGSFTYTPDADYNGTDSFTYVANDGQDGSNVATVAIAVNAVADAPVAVDDSAATTPDTPVTIDLLANDFDPDGDTLLIAALGTASDGSLVDNGDGTVTYTPALGFTGTDTFSYTVSDGALTDTATVTVDVTEQSTEVRYDSIDTPKPLADASPKGTPGVTTSTITPDGTFRVMAIEYSISHDLTFQLDITLITPNGDRIGLPEPANGTSTTSWDLSTLDPSYTTGTGEWTLEVLDTMKGEKGTLEGWALIGETVTQPLSGSITDAALLAWADLDSSDDEDRDPLATQAADELALMMME